MRTKILSCLGLLIVAAMLLAASGSPVYAQSAEAGQKSPRTLVVNGVGKVYLTPDIAYISIGVHTENKDATKAVGDNNASSQKVLNALTGLKIDAKDIRTTNFNIFPQQQYDQAGKLTGVIYVVDNTVYVTLRDLSKIGNLLDQVIAAGANSIGGITFDVADKSKALSDARKLAVTDAKTQAQELAQAAGVSLGAIQTISTSNSAPAPVYEGKGGGGAAPMATSVAVPVSAGQMYVEVDVNLVYEIQ